MPRLCSVTDKIEGEIQLFITLDKLQQATVSLYQDKIQMRLHFYSFYTHMLAHMLVALQSLVQWRNILHPQDKTKVSHFSPGKNKYNYIFESYRFNKGCQNIRFSLHDYESQKMMKERGYDVWQRLTEASPQCYNDTVCSVSCWATRTPRLNESLVKLTSFSSAKPLWSLFQTSVWFDNK